MREILFRGKRVLGRQEWTYGVPFIDHEGDCIFKTSASEYIVDGNTVGQYTGLTDKNGNEIFEGDIILFEDESPTNYEYHDCTEMRCGEVRFENGQFYLTNRIAVEMFDLIYNGTLDGIIIGNIHDNPELLKGE